jgi:hypothetical protein
MMAVYKLLECRMGFDQYHELPEELKRSFTTIDLKHLDADFQMEPGIWHRRQDMRLEKGMHVFTEREGFSVQGAQARSGSVDRARE